MTRRATPSLRILVLTKRQYMGRDLIDDRYGRFREIPLELVRLGHSVRGICLSYRPRPQGEIVDECAQGSDSAAVTWRSLNLGRAVLPGVVAHWSTLRREATAFRPDVVLACSDAFHVVRGVALARAVDACAVVDLYDNFEGFRGTKFPPILQAFRRAVRKADLVCCVSAPLSRRVQERYGRIGRTEVLQNAVRTDLFRPGDRTEARRSLGLPFGARLIGVTGAISASRDVETLFRAVDILAREDPLVQLVVAGPRDRHLNWPSVAQVHDFGILDHARVPALLRALDLAVTPNCASAFGEYCFPQKVCEAIACGIPVVTAATAAMSEFFAEEPERLYRVGDAAHLVSVLSERLAIPRPSSVRVQDWRGISLRLEELMRSTDSKTATG